MLSGLHIVHLFKNLLSRKLIEEGHGAHCLVVEVVLRLARQSEHFHHLLHRQRPQELSHPGLQSGMKGMFDDLPKRPIKHFKVNSQRQLY